MKEYQCYIEEYCSNGALCARLREKSSDKQVILVNADKMHFLQFLSVAKMQFSVMPTIFDRNGDDFVLVQGTLVKEDAACIYLKDAGYLFA